MKRSKMLRGSKKEYFLRKLHINVDLLNAAHSRDSDKILSLLNEGANPNVQDDDGNTPLHLALSCGCANCMENAESCCTLLLNAVGINVNLPNRHGQTPMDIAILNQLDQCAKSLISKGAICYGSNDEGIFEAETVGINPAYLPAPEEEQHNKEHLVHAKSMEILQDEAFRDPERLFTLLSNGTDPNVQDCDGNTLLHLALDLTCSCKICVGNADSCSAVLLNDSRTDVNCQNKKGETPLHLATLNQLERCAEDLIFKGANCYLMSKDGTVAMILIATRMPDLMCKILDHSIFMDSSHSHHRKVECEIKIDFRPIVLLKRPLERTESPKAPQENPFPNELKLLNSVISSDLDTQKKILLHPVVGIFLNQKWRRARIHLITSVIVRLIWLLFFTNYIVLVYLMKCPIKTTNGSKNASTNQPRSYTPDVTYPNFNGKELTKEQQDCLEASEINTEFILICVLTIWRLLFNIVELYFSSKVTLRDIHHIIVLCMVFGTFYPTLARQVEIPSSQYQYAALTVFLAWSMNMSLFGKFKKIGGYFEMFGHVLWRFLTILPTFIFLFVAFAFAFCIMFPTKRFFDSFPFAIFRVIQMTIEIDYVSTFYGSDEDTKSHGPIVGHLLYAIYVIVISIVLLNLLIGLTVSDIKNLQKEAELKQITVQVNEMYNMECILYSKIFPNFFRNFLRKTLSAALNLKKGDSNELYFSFRINDPKDGSVPTELKAAAKPLVEEAHNERQAKICKKRCSFSLIRTTGTGAFSNILGMKAYESPAAEYNENGHLV